MNRAKAITYLLPLSLVGVFLLSLTAPAIAQNPSIAGGDPLSDSPPTGVEACVTSKQDVPRFLLKWKTTEQAMARFRDSTGSITERLALLDGLAVSMSNTIREISEGSYFYQDVENAIKTSIEQQKKFAVKASDLTLKPETRNEYLKLADRFNENMISLNEKRIKIDNLRSNLVQRSAYFSGEKELIADLIAEDFTNEANKRLIDLANEFKKPASPLPPIIRDISAP